MHVTGGGCTAKFRQAEITLGVIGCGGIASNLEKLNARSAISRSGSRRHDGNYQFEQLQVILKHMF